MKKILTIFSVLSFIIIGINQVEAQTIGETPYPNVGTANVDGLITGDSPNWNLNRLEEDWFADMYKAWDENKEVLSYLYIRYDCDTKTMYVLVYQKDGTIPLQVDGDHWIAIDGFNNKVLQESDGDDGTPPDFAFIDIGYDGNSNHARGWEGSFVVDWESFTDYTTDITAHANVDESGTPATSGTGNKEIEIILDCEDVLPVELSSFSVSVINDLAQLNWETATEINNYGFEIQRKSEIEDWSKVGFVEGYGNSNSPKYYSFTDASVSKKGTYSYRLKQIDIDGQYEYSDVVNVTLNIADIRYQLNQNYPNPFNPTTTISFTLPEQTNVKLTIYNVFGEEITTIVNDVKDAGTHNIIFTAQNLASGMYYYTIETENYSATKKLILLK